MATFTINHTRIAGLAACVPKSKESNWEYDWLTEKERKMLIKTIGIETRRVGPPEQCTSDWCFVAAQKLMQKLQWDATDIDVLIMVSQSPDYFVPATSIILQERLQLKKTCLAFDVNLGCSGYVYGLSVIGSMLAAAGGHLKKALLLVGDKSTSSLNKKDKTTYPLFGDAGTATALQWQADVPPMHFNLQSDGKGYQTIMIPDGATRNPINENTFKDVTIAPGIIRNQRNLVLDGFEVFNFSLREVMPNINALLNYTQTQLSDYDYYLFHQANKLINETIAKKLKLDKSKLPYSIHQYGNTSSASIPLTIVSQLQTAVSQQNLSVLLAGFGVGLSWGSVTLSLNQIVCLPVLEL